MKRFVGSSKGWLIFVHGNVEDKTFGVTLVNPFLRIKGRKNKDDSIIGLPALTPLGWEEWYVNCEDYVCRATISADPISNPKDCVTVIHMHRNTSAFIRLGKDTTWTSVDVSVDNALEDCQMIEEVTNFGNKFYAANYDREVISFDVTARTYSDVKLVGSGTPVDCITSERYIFEGEENKFLIVQRYLGYTEDDIRVTKKFGFELNLQTGEWTEKKTLGGVALFVGDNASICVSAAKNCGLEPHCIYFNHDCDYLGSSYHIHHDFGVYNVEDQSSQKLTPTVFLQNSYPQPIWIKPVLSFPL